MKPSLSLKARALQMLAQREHSRIELRRKLLVHAGRVAAAAEPANDSAFFRRALPSPEQQSEVDALLDWLEAERHLSQARFVEARVRARAGRNGNLRIRQELAQHGLHLTPAEEQALKDSELTRAQQVLERKFTGPADDRAGQARQARFLAGRGFSSDAIQRALRGAGADR